MINVDKVCITYNLPRIFNKIMSLEQQTINASIKVFEASVLSGSIVAYAENRI